MTESLDRSTFYRFLVTNHNKLFLEASDKCCIVCIPQNRSLKNSPIDRKLITSHLLRPSPLLRLHYIPTNSTFVRDVEVDSEVLIVTHQGDRQSKLVIRILGEEVAYNSNNERYRILIIESPLYDPTEKQQQLISRKSTLIEDDSELFISLTDCREYLKCLSSEITCDIEKKTLKLVNTYMILPDYLDDAAQRLKAVIDWGEQRFSNEVEKEINQELLSASVESLVIGLVHDKIFPAVLKKYSSEETQLKEKFAEIRKYNVTPEYLGAQPIFNTAKVNSQLVDQLKDLNKMVTPLEKLASLKRTLDLINEILIQCCEESMSPFDKAAPSALPDDLVAVTIYILSLVQPPYLITNIQYIQNFSWQLPSKNEFGYSRVTFEVASGYISSFNYSKDPEESQVLSHDMASNGNDFNSQSNDSNQSSPLNRIPSQVDYELERITRLIEKNESDLRQESAGSSSFVSNNKRESPDEDLGEFLSSLRSNNFVVGSGKQS